MSYLGMKFTVSGEKFFAFIFSSAPLSVDLLVFNSRPLFFYLKEARVGGEVGELGNNKLKRLCGISSRSH
jgi:hypothetical protein